MRFSHQFESLQFEEWRRQYVKYHSIKLHIHQLFQHRQQTDKTTGAAVSHYGALLNEANFQSAVEEDAEDDELSARTHADYVREEGAGAALLSFQERTDQVLTKFLMELHKIDDFYRAVEGELLVGFQSLKAQIATAVVEGENAGEERPEAMINLKTAFIQLLRRETMLIHYVDLNLYALARLLRLFEARAGLAGVSEKFHRTVQARYIAHSRVLEDELIPATYQLFADSYENGDLERAKVYLLGKLSETAHNRVDAFLLGLKIGIMTMLFVWNCMLLLKPIPGQSETLASLAPYAPAYRACGLLIFLLWLWGCAVCVWDHYRIAYIFVFQLNPRHRLTHFQIFSEAANLSIVYFLNGLLLISHYEAALDRFIPAAVYPLSLFLFLLIKLFGPGRLFSHWDARKTLLASMIQIVCAPFGRVRFRETFIADILTSLVKVLVDMEYLIVLIASGGALESQAGLVQSSSSSSSGPSVSDYLIPFVCCIPLWWRFQQCLRRYFDTRQRFPHLLNALKYAVAHSVVIISVFHPAFGHSNTNWAFYRVIWLFSTVISSLYTFVWDIWQDWGLIQWKPGERPHFRSHRLYGSRVFYCWAAGSNFFLRFGWVLTLVPFEIQDSHLVGQKITWFDQIFSWQTILLPCLSLMELLRRFQWSLLRVEWEQLTIFDNAGFRMSYFASTMIQQNQGEKKNKNTANAEKSDIGIVAEVALMVGLVLLVAILGALL